MTGALTARLLKPMAGAAILSLLLAYAPNLLADDPIAHPQANVSMCRGCHGIAQYRTAFPEVYSVPRLGGQQAAYIVKALQDYKQGLRTHATMRGIAALLTDEQMAAIAAYYAADGK
jgi:cytochrome c553